MESLGASLSVARKAPECSTGIRVRSNSQASLRTLRASSPTERSMKSIVSIRNYRWITIVLAAFSVVGAAVGQSPSVELEKTLHKIDAASVKFKSVEAEIVWENVQTQPIEDKDTQTGTVIFQRKSGELSMALHLKVLNGKPVVKDMVYAGGLFKLYEPRLKQMQVFKAGSNRENMDTFLALGFGGSSKDLEKNWTVSYIGAEQVSGVATSKLELQPRTDSVKKMFTKVILWVDMENGIALKQQSFDPSGNYRVVSYKIQHLNGSLPSDAFEVKTAPDTRIVNR